MINDHLSFWQVNCMLNMPLHSHAQPMTHASLHAPHLNCPHMGFAHMSVYKSGISNLYVYIQYNTTRLYSIIEPEHQFALILNKQSRSKVLNT